MTLHPLVGMAENEGIKGLERLKRKRDLLRSKYPEHVWQMIEKRAENEIANRQVIQKKLA
jgi:hypothetical protein